MRRIARSVDNWIVPWIIALSVLISSPLRVQAEEGQAAPQESSTITIQRVAPTEIVEDKPLSAPHFDIDLFAFLAARDAQGDSASDNVWIVKAAPGMKLLQLPIIVEAGREETALGASTFRIKGGRFLAYKLADETEKAVAGSEAERQLEAGLPPGTPRITRKMIITPKGRVKWSMDRTISSFGGTLKPDQLYSLKIDYELLSKKQPPKPERVVPNAGESMRDYRARKAEADARNRAASNAYRDISKAVRELPDDFEMPIPARIWVLFEYNRQSIEITGPEPLPWELTQTQLKMLRDGMTAVQVEAGGTGGAPRLPRSALESIALMTTMITEDKHPLTARAISFVLSESRLVPYAERGDSLYKLMEQVLKSSDPTARQVVIKELARTFPPTAASLSLSKLAMKDMDTQTQMVWLKSLAKTDNNSKSPSPTMGNAESGRAQAVQLQQMLNQVNELLASPTGPPPQEVVALLVEYVKGNPETLDMTVEKVRFEDIPEGRLDDAIVAVVNQASTEPVAAGWLDKKLIGSSDPKIIRRTLEVISKAGSGATVAASGVRPAEFLLDLTFGPSRTSSKNVAGATITEPIRLSSTSHSLFRALQNGNPEIRALAWGVLPRFTLDDKPLGNNPSQQPGLPAAQTGMDQDSNPAQALLNAALAQNPTPLQAVEVLSRQHDTTAAASAMVMMVIRGSTDASRQATRVLLRSKNNWPVDKALMEQGYSDRQAFAARTYENLTGKAPLVAGLMRQKLENNPLVEWFGKELANGSTPSTGEWASHAGGEDKLLDLVMSADAELSRGAMAALVAEAGGDDRIVQPLTQKLTQLPDTTLANLKTQWASARRDIYTMRLSRSDGPYMLVVRVANQTSNQPPVGPQGVPPGAPPMPMPPGPPLGGKPGEEAGSGIADATTIELGLVQLQADGQSIKLANQALTLSVPSDKMAIRVDKPSELKNFNNPQIDKLSIDQVTTSVDLLPQQDGSWRGSFVLPPENRQAELVLIPASEEYRR